MKKNTISTDRPRSGRPGPTPRRSRCALLGAMLLSLLAVTTQAQVTNNFEVDDPGGGFPGSPGNGWADTWNIAVGVNGSAIGFEAPPGQVINTAPLNGGNNYLNFGFANADNNLMRRKYTSTGDLDVSQPHIVEFDYRVDAWLPANGFTGSSDYFTLCARYDTSTSSSDNDSTWWIKAIGQNNVNGNAIATAGRWNFYEGGISGSESVGTFTNAALPAFAIGRTYHFKIITDPTTKTYVGSVTDGTNTFTTGSLKWRSSAIISAANAANSTILYFASRTSTRSVQPAATETNIVSVDNITINHTPFDNALPRITLIQPGTATMHFPSASNVVFSALTIGSTNTMPTSGYILFFNGVDVSGGLTVDGTNSDTNRTAFYTGLVPNTIYEGVLMAMDQAGRTATNTFFFDTFAETDVTVVEAENYNFETGANSCPGVPRTNFNSNGYLQNPLPSAYDVLNGVYINEMGGYVDRAGVAGVDYLDVSASVNYSGYRLCDTLDTRTTPGAEYVRPAFTNAPTPDYVLEHIDAGEWANYTHVFPNTNYYVYLRVGARNATVHYRLSRVTSDRTQPNQITVPLGTITVPPLPARETLKYRPLADAFGNPLLLHLNGEETLRLTALDATTGDDTYVNFILLSPQPTATAPPYVLQHSPLANETNVPPQTGINLVLGNGSAPVAINTIILNVNGSNVTSLATITPTAGGATVNYLPPIFFPGLSFNTVQVIYGDGSGSLQTNQWSFHVGTYLPGTPVKVNFQQPASTNFPGYLPDTSLSFGDRGNGYSYGWDRDFSQDARQNFGPAVATPPNSAPAPDQRYATFTHLNKSSPPRVFEITLPNGNYGVFAVCGDATAIDSIFKITVEGVLVVDGIPFYPDQWVSGTNVVTVSDGRLTLTTGGANGTAAGGNNNKIDFIDITPLDYPPIDFTLRNPKVSGSAFSFNVATINRAVQIIEYKDDLGGGPWSLLTTIVGDGSSRTVTDPVPAGGQRFYRMRFR